MAVDFFLKLEGPDVEGESMDSHHADEIAINSWSWGMNQSGTMHVAKGGGAIKKRASTRPPPSSSASIAIARAPRFR